MRKRKEEPIGEEARGRMTALWDRYSRVLLAYVRGKLAGIEGAKDAEDLVGDAFLLLMTHYEQYGGRTDEQLRATLLRICRNLIVTEARRAGKIRFSSLTDEEGEDAEIPDPDPIPEELLVSEDAAQRLREIVRGLDPAYRDVLSMSLYEEMSGRQIAEELGITEGAVRVRLYRARKKVLEKWKEDEDEESGRI